MPTRIDSFWIGKGGIEDWERNDGRYWDWRGQMEGERKGRVSGREDKGMDGRKGREEEKRRVQYKIIVIIYNNIIYNII